MTRARRSARRWLLLDGVLGAAFVGLLLLVVTSDGPPAVDARVFAESPPAQGLHSFAPVSWLANVVADAGDPTGWTVGTLLGAGTVALTWRSWLPLRFVAPPVLIQAGAVSALKAAVGRPGPPGNAVDGTWGFFPSGHTATALVCAGALAALVAVRRPTWARALRTGVLVWSVCMAAALVYVGYHWLTDVIASLLLGLLILRITCPVLWAPERSGDDPAAQHDPPRRGEHA